MVTRSNRPSKAISAGRRTVGIHTRFLGLISAAKRGPSPTAQLEHVSAIEREIKKAETATKEMVLWKKPEAEIEAQKKRVEELKSLRASLVKRWGITKRQKSKKPVSRVLQKPQKALRPAAKRAA